MDFLDSSYQASGHWAIEHEAWLGVVVIGAGCRTRRTQ
jgi:hypothetical protein